MDELFKTQGLEQGISVAIYTFGKYILLIGCNQNKFFLIDSHPIVENANVNVQEWHYLQMDRRHNNVQFTNGLFEDLESLEYLLETHSHLLYSGKSFHRTDNNIDFSPTLFHLYFFCRPTCTRIQLTYTQIDSTPENTQNSVQGNLTVMIHPIFLAQIKMKFVMAMRGSLN